MAMEHNQVLALILKIEGKFLEMEIAVEDLQPRQYVIC
jgi:hypothetical protein